MLKPDYTRQFIRDHKAAKKRKLDIALLDGVMYTLIAQEPLSVKHNDHPLTGNWAHHRECHIQPD